VTETDLDLAECDRLKVRFGEVQPVQSPLVSHNEDFAGVIQPKRCDALRRFTDLSNDIQLAVLLGEGPQSFRLKVAEDVGADIRGAMVPPIDIASRHGDSILAPVREDGGSEGGSLPAILV
jgi:hypothetical protein